MFVILSDGEELGRRDGMSLGILEGSLDSSLLGVSDVNAVGVGDGTLDGWLLKVAVGFIEGCEDGSLLAIVGAEVGLDDGPEEG